jgi:hypothetical protein
MARAAAAAVTLLSLRLSKPGGHGASGCSAQDKSNSVAAPVRAPVCCLNCRATPRNTPDRTMAPACTHSGKTTTPQHHWATVTGL